MNKSARQALYGCKDETTSLKTLFTPAAIKEEMEQSSKELMGYTFTTSKGRSFS